MDFLDRFSLQIGYQHFTISCGPLYHVYLHFLLKETLLRNGFQNIQYCIKQDRKEYISHTECFGNGSVSLFSKGLLCTFAQQLDSWVLMILQEKQIKCGLALLLRFHAFYTL